MIPELVRLPSASDQVNWIIVRSSSQRLDRRKLVIILGGAAGAQQDLPVQQALVLPELVRASFAGATRGSRTRLIIARHGCAGNLCAGCIMIDVLAWAAMQLAFPSATPMHRLASYAPPGSGCSHLVLSSKAAGCRLGHETKHFNVGSYRRKQRTDLEVQNADLFDHKNAVRVTASALD